MDDLETIRRMTPAEKLEQWRRLVRAGWRYFSIPDQATGRRKWEQWEREHEQSNLNLVRGLLERDREPAPRDR